MATQDACERTDLPTYTSAPIQPTNRDLLLECLKEKWGHELPTVKELLAAIVVPGTCPAVVNTGAPTEGGN